MLSETFCCTEQKLAGWKLLLASCLWARFDLGASHMPVDLDLVIEQLFHTLEASLLLLIFAAAT